jgi:hypothetical protein
VGRTQGAGRCGLCFDAGSVLRSCVVLRCRPGASGRAFLFHALGEVVTCAAVGRRVARSRESRGAQRGHLLRLRWRQLVLMQAPGSGGGSSSTSSYPSAMAPWWRWRRRRGTPGLVPSGPDPVSLGRGRTRDGGCVAGSGQRCQRRRSAVVCFGVWLGDARSRVWPVFGM